MKFHVIAFLALFGLTSDGWAENAATPSQLPLWGGLEVQGLDMSDDFRSLNVAVPLPALPYMPRLSYHRHAYETQARHSGAWHSGGAHSVQAQLPFGLTFEVGNRLDRFGRHDPEFVGLTFTYSRLRHHNHLLAAYKGSPQPGPIHDETDTPRSEGKPQNSGAAWKLAGSLALVAILAGGGGSDTSSTLTPSTDNGVDVEQPYFVEGNPGEWQEVWFDPFDGTELDGNKWNMTDSYDRDQCFGGGNGEQQCYTSNADNISVSNGKLLLTARPAVGISQPYTSGRIQSMGKGDFTYGKFEARIKLPGGQGSWPAFWMLPSDRAYGEWAASGEIDIMEAVNLGGTAVNCGAPCKDIHGTLHFGGEWPNHSQTPSSTFTLNDINAFHTYTLEWYPDEMRWFVDGTEYGRKGQNLWSSSSPQAAGDPNAPFDRDFHMILNLAIGGMWPGATDGQNFPRQMEVEYVRVSQCGGDDPLACKQ